MSMGAALFAFAPKCPISFLAYFGIFGVATSSASAYHTWLPPITGFWLALTIAMLTIQRRGKRRYGPAWLAFGGAVLLMAGKFVTGVQVMVFVGVVALLAAAVWRSRIQQPVATQECSQCENLAG
jgi:hypothetical protein